MQATFAAGCFWGVEAAFRRLKGVTGTTVGYSGGHLANPNYEEVCTGETGHAESVLVEYDPGLISYRELLNCFWAIHDPTTLNRQGPDRGTQYRSVIFFHSAEQEKEAIESKARQNNPRIVTEIRPSMPFYRAEEYHQCFLEKKSLSNSLSIQNAQESDLSPPQD